jgi:hypothetical protein
MFSFQPGAFIGNTARWKDDYRDLTGDRVWAEIERGAGARLPFRIFQNGDERCNRVAHGLQIGERWVPFMDDLEPGDLHARDLLYSAIGGLDFQVPPFRSRVSPCSRSSAEWSLGGRGSSRPDWPGGRGSSDGPARVPGSVTGSGR